MAIFGPKPWVNPFGKNFYFSTFWTSCFYSLERRFFEVEYKKTFSWPILPKKKLEKWPILHQNYGLTPLKKCQFYRLYELFVFIGYKGAFSM